MHHHLNLRSKVIIMLSVMASLFLVALDQTIISTSLGKIVEEFNAFSSLGWVVTAYLIATTVTVPIAGKLSDLFGRRILLLLGITIFSAGSLMGGMSGNIDQLIMWRAFQGIGGGIITANTFAIVGDLFAARERGKWQGLIGAVFGVSSVVGPLLGGFLADANNVFGLTTNWRWTLFINVPIGILAFVVIAIFCPTLKHDKHPKVDYIGAALLAMALTILVLAIDNTEAIFGGFMSSTGLTLANLRVIMFLLVAILVTIFIVTERRAKEPILPTYFFKNRNFVLMMTIATLFGSAFMGSILYLTQFNQQVFAATPTQSGLMLLPMVGGMTFASIGIGQLISRKGKYKLFMQLGFATATIAIACLTTLNPSSTYGFEAVVMIFLGMGMGVAMPVINLVVQNEFAQHDLGAATSSSQLFRSLGSTIGVAIFGSILTAGIVTSLGDMSNNAYVKSLSKSAAVAKIGDLNNTDTLLNLNMHDIKSEINKQSTLAFAKLPAPIAKQAETQFKNQQKDFSTIIVKAYSDGMHTIFVAATALMTAATIVSFAIKEKPLRSAKASETPGEI